MAKIDVVGCALYYDVHGSGEPLVLVHGTGTDSTTWNPVIERLAAQHQVIVYDRRGYGRSVHPPVRDYRIHANDLRIILAELCNRRAHLIGWSSGGNVSIAVAAADTSQIASLCVVEAPFHSVRLGDRSVLATTARVKWKQLRGDRMGAGEAFFRSVFALRSGRNAYDDADERVREMMRSNIEPVLAEFDPHPFGVSSDHISARAAAAAAIPMRWVLGDQSPLWLERTHRRFARHRRDLETVVIPGVGHLAHEENPQAFVAAVKPTVK